MFQRLFRNPVDSIKYVIDFHSEMQRNSPRDVQQSRTLQILDSFLVRASRLAERRKLTTALRGSGHSSIDVSKKFGRKSNRTILIFDFAHGFVKSIIEHIVEAGLVVFGKRSIFNRAERLNVVGACHKILAIIRSAASIRI